MTDRSDNNPDDESEIDNNRRKLLGGIAAGTIGTAGCMGSDNEGQKVSGGDMNVEMNINNTEVFNLDGEPYFRVEIPSQPVLYNDADDTYPASHMYVTKGNEGVVQVSEMEKYATTANIHDIALRTNSKYFPKDDIISNFNEYQYNFVVLFDSIGSGRTTHDVKNAIYKRIIVKDGRVQLSNDINFTSV